MSALEYKLLNVRKNKSYSSVVDKYINFHCGCTYYEKTKQGYKIGCDYNHLHDNEYGHSLENIESDVRKCIDNFLTTFSYLRWCGNCGNQVKLNEGKSKDIDEGCYAFTCQKCIDKPKEESKQSVKI